MQVGQLEPPLCKVCRRELTKNKFYCSMRCRLTEVRKHSCKICLKPLAKKSNGHYRKTCSEECANTALMRFRGKWNATRNYRLHGWHENRTQSTHQHSEELEPQYRYVAVREIGNPEPRIHGRYILTTPVDAKAVRFRIGQTLYGEGQSQGSAIWAVYNCSDEAALLLPDSTTLYARINNADYQTAPDPYEKTARKKLPSTRKRGDKHV